jgi:hypothetical protein
MTISHKIVEIFSGLFKDYREELSEKNETAYLIQKLPSLHDANIYFQIRGKNILLKMLPEKLMHAEFLMGFSKADIAIIIHLGTKNEMEQQQSANSKPKLFMRIAQQLFGAGGKTKFLLKMHSKDELVETIPEEIMCNKKALNMLKGSEAALIGYAAAENRMINIRKQINPTATCHIIEHDLKHNLISYIDQEREAKHTLHLHDIFNNKTLFNLFGKTDQQLMSFAAGEMHQKRLQPSTNIATLKLSSYLGNLAKFTDLDENTHSMSFQELAFDAELLKQFSQSDRDMIRFAAGECSAQEKAKLYL